MPQTAWSRGLTYKEKDENDKVLVGGMQMWELNLCGNVLLPSMVNDAPCLIRGGPKVICILCAWSHTRARACVRVCVREHTGIYH